PRHDALIRDPGTPARTILVMPTWRSWLVGSQGHESSERTTRPGFLESDFATRWLGLLKSERLRELADRSGYTMTFLPHVHLRGYLEALQLPRHVTVPDADTLDLQALFRRASVVVTDFSSVAFEAALIYRSVIY